MNDVASLLRTGRRQAFLAVSIVLVIVGLWRINESQQSVDWNYLLGTTALSTGLISAIWQIVVDRWQSRMTKESLVSVLSNHDPDQKKLKAALQSVLQETSPTLGLQRTRLGTKLDISSAIANCSSLSIICLYDKRWSEDWKAQVIAFKGSIRVCIPDPKDEILMGQLAARHGRSTVASFRNDVLALLNFFIGLGRPGEVEVRLVPAPGPAYTCYLFGSEDGEGRGLTRMYKHRMPDNAHQLTEQDFSQGGGLYRSYLDDFDAIWAVSKRFPKAPSRNLHIAVIGPGDADLTAAAYIDAVAVGKSLAERSSRLAQEGIKIPGTSGTYQGITLINGGGFGVMEAAALGVKNEDDSVPRRAYLPDLDPSRVNEYMTADQIVATGKGEWRNFDLIEDSDAIIAVGCNPGTLVEAAWSGVLRKPVFGVGSWDVLESGRPVLIAPMSSAKDAVNAAVEGAIRSRIARARQ